MTKCIKERIVFPSCQGRIVEAQFAEEEVTSDGGVLLLREIDRQINLTAELANLVPDPRTLKCDRYSTGL